MRQLLLLGFLLLGSYNRSWAQAAPAAYQLRGNTLVLPSPISFRPGTASLLPASEPALQHLRQYLEAKSYISLLRLEGHVADGAGAQALSEQRAQAVAAWLVGHGIACRRLLAVGFGSTKPVAPAGAEANTRLEAVNAALLGRLIGGLPADGGGQVAGSSCP